MKTVIALCLGLFVLTSCTNGSEKLATQGENQEDHLYLTNEQMSKVIVIPEGVFNEKYSNLDNWRAYKLGGIPYVVKDSTNLTFDGWYQQHVTYQTSLRFNPELGQQGKNVDSVDLVPQDEAEIAWLVMIVIFLYYLLFGRWVAVSKNDLVLVAAFVLVAAVAVTLMFAVPVALVVVVALALAVVLVAAFASVKSSKYTFFIGSAVAMVATWYFFNTYVFLVPTVAGLVLALLWYQLTKKKPREGLEPGII
ncbi:hypothetical protein KC929_01480 [Patescibacteria group bacterium]|nr:hypothetical protein [Patescibacteria group bacterium]